jgi:coenzyme F420-reducing hydrogenase delta subunit
LVEIGLEPERVEMFNLSAAMAGEFVNVTKSMTERIEGMGKSKLREMKEEVPS